jgi:hypothetical protein
MLISQCYLHTSANKLYINILKCQEGEQIFLQCGLFRIFQVWLPVKEMVYIVRVPNCSVIFFWKELRRGEFPRLDFIKIQREFQIQGTDQELNRALIRNTIAQISTPLAQTGYHGGRGKSALPNSQIITNFGQHVPCTEALASEDGGVPCVPQPPEYCLKDWWPCLWVLIWGRWQGPDFDIFCCW